MDNTYLIPKYLLPENRSFNELMTFFMKWDTCSGGSPIEISDMNGEKKRFDFRTKQHFIDETKNNVDRNEKINAALEILCTRLNVHVNEQLTPSDNYLRFKNPVNDIYQKFDEDNHLLCIWSNVRYLLYVLLGEYQQELFIRKIIYYIEECKPYPSMKVIDEDLQNICKFTYKVYSMMLEKHRKSDCISNDYVGKIILKLLKTRFYADVYLVINGVLAHEEDLNSLFWIGNLRQERITPLYCLSMEDKKQSMLYDNYRKRQEEKLKDMDNEISDLESMRDDLDHDECEDLDIKLDLLKEARAELSDSIMYMKDGYKAATGS